MINRREPQSLKERTATWAWLGMLALVAAALAFAAHSRFNPHEHNLPAGCDEFGYLNMAKAIAEGRTFANHADRPFIDDLIGSLQGVLPETNHYRWMVAPHAYHLGPDGEKIINQYPPGVGLMLAFLPLEVRRIAFPIASLVLCLIPLAIAGRIDTGKLSLLPLALLPLLAIALYQFDPWAWEFRRVSSLAPTYGLLIASGWLLPRHPSWSIAFLSASTLFRIPNALLFAPVGLACLFLSSPSTRSIGVISRLAIRFGAILLATGFGAYLIYASILIGNPFAPTYSTLDQEFTKPSDLSRNLEFYFQTHDQWLRIHYVALIALGIACALRRNFKWMLFGLATCLFNYGFYVFHKVRIDYYPYASAMICVGLAIGVAELSNLRMWPRRIAIGAGAIACLAFTITSRLPDANQPEQFEAKLLPYRAGFAEFDVVWAEFRSGTVEYATNRAGFRYNWGTDEARRHAITWLRDHGYTQAIWVDDHEMKPRAEIEALLQSSSIDYTVRNIDVLGDCLVIPPKPRAENALHR